MIKHTLELCLISILFLLIGLIFQSQQRISHQNGQGWDGVYYYHMAEQMLQGADRISGELPFVRRVGTPFLVAHYSKYRSSTLLDAALVVNLAGIYITVLLLLFWLRLYLKKSWLRVLLCFLFMMAWYVPLRMNFYEPMTSDAWGAVWFMLALLLLVKIRKVFYINKMGTLIGYISVYAIVISIGVLFRESNSVLSIALLFLINPLKVFSGIKVNQITLKTIKEVAGNLWQMYFQKRVLLLFLPILFVILVNQMLNQYLDVTESDYSYVKALFFWFYKKSMPEYALGILSSCGPLIVLLPFYYKEIKSILWKNQEQFLLLFLSFFFAFFAGADTERIFFMSAFPFILVWMGFAIQGLFSSANKWWLFVLIALQTIAFRFYWNLPDFPNDYRRTPFPFFTLIGENFQYLFLYSFHGQYILNSLILMEYGALFLFSWYLLSSRKE